MTFALRLFSIVLSFGLVLIIERVIDRLNLNPRWKYLVQIIVIANEIRGATTVYLVWDKVWGCIL